MGGPFISGQMILESFVGVKKAKDEEGGRPCKDGWYICVITILEDHEEVVEIVYWINLCLNLMGIIFKEQLWKNASGEKL